MLNVHNVYDPIESLQLLHSKFYKMNIKKYKQ